MKIVIPGGSGQIGRFLATHFHNKGHDVSVLSRKPSKTGYRTHYWDGCTLGEWATLVDGADVVINLAGRSVNCRYTTYNRHIIKQSRTESTRIVGQAIAAAASPPPVWLQMSTATIYVHTFGAANDEAHGVLGNTLNDPDTWRFSYDVAASWEDAAYHADTPHTRKVLLRSAMVMDAAPDGVFHTLSKLVNAGLGGRSGHGKQYVSWIHEIDFLRVVEFLIERDDISGPVNLAAPNPLTNTTFMRMLRQAWGAKFGIPATEWMIEIGTRLLRTESELVLKSRRVVSSVLADAGFEFMFPNWDVASADLVHRWKRER